MEFNQKYLRAKYTEPLYTLHRWQIQSKLHVWRISLRLVNNRNLIKREWAQLVKSYEYFCARFEIKCIFLTNHRMEQEWKEKQQVI